MNIHIALEAFILVIGLFGFIIVLLVLLGNFLNKRRLPFAPVDAALVFGTGLAWKAESRLTTATRLFQRGLVRHTIVSGGVVVSHRGLTEATWFRESLIERGIPSDRILVEDRATNTAENAEFALPIIKQCGFKAIVLVMSDFEGIRAHLTAKKAWQGHGINIYDDHAPSPGHWNA